MSDVRDQRWLIDVSEDDSVSNAIDRQQLDLMGAEIPDDFDAGNISFLVGLTAATLGPLTWEGAAVSFAVTAGDRISWDPLKFAGWPWVALVSDADEGDDREIVPVLRNLG